MRAARLFVATSWIPPAAFLAVSWDLKRLEGWGAWAAASAFMPVAGLSVVMGLVGATLWVRERRNGNSSVTLLIATLLAGSVGLWFLARVAYLEITRSF